MGLKGAIAPGDKPSAKEEANIAAMNRERAKRISDARWALNHSRLRGIDYKHNPKRAGDLAIERRVQDRRLDELVRLGALG